MPREGAKSARCGVSWQEVGLSYPSGRQWL